MLGAGTPVRADCASYARARRAALLACLATAALSTAVPAQSGAAAAPASAPVWAKPDHFWFHRAVPGGHVWLTVDAEHGVKEPLFDHQRLAIELSLRTGTEFTPLTLPFADSAMHFVVKYDGSNAYIQEGALAIEFVLRGTLWRCDLQIKWDWNRVPPTDYECLGRRPAAPDHRVVHERGPVRSPDGRWEALVVEHNIGVRATGAAPSDLTRLTTDGASDHAYQAGSIVWSADSGSFYAYRVHADVMRADSFNADVRTLVTRHEWRIPPR